MWQWDCPYIKEIIMYIIIETAYVVTNSPHWCPEIIIIEHKNRGMHVHVRKQGKIVLFMYFSKLCQLLVYYTSFSFYAEYIFYSSSIIMHNRVVLAELLPSAVGCMTIQSNNFISSVLSPIRFTQKFSICRVCYNFRSSLLGNNQLNPPEILIYYRLHRYPWGTHEMTGRTHDSTQSNTTYLVTLVRSLQYIREPTGTHHAFPITSVTLQCRVSLSIGLTQ